MRFHSNYQNETEEYAVEQGYVYDSAARLASNTFVKPGSTFLGWATVEGGKIVYANKDNNGGEPFNLSAENGAVVHLFAVWN